MTASARPPAAPGIGTSSATALVVANMVGVGVFTTSGYALESLARPWVLAAWIAGGGLALCGALCYGALARQVPGSGGEYLFLSRTLTPAAGFLAGWVSLLAGFTAPIAASALALEAYLFGAEGGGRWPGTAAIAAAVGMHGIRRRHGVLAQNAVVAFKLVLLASLIAFGAVRIASLETLPEAEAPPFDAGAFAVTLIWISFAYSGWNAAVYVAGEVREPRRNLRRSLVAGTCAVSLLYLGLNAVFVYAAPGPALAGRAEIGAIAAEALGGDALRLAVSWLTALALFTSVSSMVMAGPRVYARMAEDGLFPRAFSMRAGVPTAAVLLQGGLAIGVLWCAGLAELLGYCGFTLGLCAAAAVVGLVRLRLREGASRVPVPGFPWVPLAFVVTTLATSAFLVVERPAEALWGLLTVLAGVPVYVGLRQRQRVRAASSQAPRR